MEFNLNINKGFMSVKDNDTFLFPIVKEAIVTDTGEIKAKFENIKKDFKYFNNKVNLTDKEVTDTLISMMFDNENNVINSILDSIPKSDRLFNERFSERITKIKHNLEQLLNKIIKEKKDIINKKQDKLDVKKRNINQYLQDKKNKEFISNFTKFMMRYLDGTERYELVMNAYKQLNVEGYLLFEELKKLGFCYNYDTKVKTKDDYIGVPFIIIYDNLNESKSSNARFLSNITEEDYFYIYTRIKGLDKIIEFEEVTGLLQAKMLEPFNFKFLFDELNKKINNLVELINDNNLLNTPDLLIVEKFSKITRKLIKLLLDRIVFSGQDNKFFSPQHLNVTLSESKKKILELNKIISDNKQLIIDNNKKSENQDEKIIESIFKLNDELEKEVTTSNLFKDIDIYIKDRINKKLIELKFPELLNVLETEFKNQIIKCTQNNTTTLIPLRIIFKDKEFEGHANMISIHNNVVELAEPHGVNISIRKRYNQIYDYLTSFLDPSKIKRVDTEFIKSGLMTSNLQPQMYEPLCDAHGHLFGLLRVMYPKLSFHEIYTMTFSKFPFNLDDLSSVDNNIVKLNLPSESNFFDRQYIMFDNLQQDRVILRLQNFILYNKLINDSLKSGISINKLITPRV